VINEDIISDLIIILGNAITLLDSDWNAATMHQTPALVCPYTIT